MISISAISGSALLVLLCLAITMWDSPSSVPSPNFTDDFSSSFYREREEKIKEMIKIEGKPYQKYILNRSETKLPVLFDIKVDHFDHDRELINDRPGFDLCIVLDRSGSMHGDKFYYSKIAIYNLIDQMIADDTLSFVVYDHEVITIFQEKTIDQKNELKKMIENIVVRGSTNLADGLKKGIDLLNETKFRENSNTRLKRLFLFSDGLINEGERREEVIGEMAKEAFTQKGITINTFGVGVDFDEKILKNISKNGEGIFFFIGNFEEIPKKITKALKMITSTIGVNCYIKFEGINGATVEAIHGETSSNSFQDEGILLREFKEGDWKRLILHLHIDHYDHLINNNNNNNKNEVEKEILKYQIEFDLIIRDEKGKFQLKPIKINGSISILFTNDQSIVSDLDNIDIETHSSIVIIQMADLEKEVIKSINEQNYDQAIHLKKKIVQSLEEIRDVDEISKEIYSFAAQNLITLSSGDYQTAKQEANYNLYLEEEILSDLSSALFD